MTRAIEGRKVTSDTEFGFVAELVHRLLWKKNQLHTVTHSYYLLHINYFPHRWYIARLVALSWHGINIWCNESCVSLSFLECSLSLFEKCIIYLLKTNICINGMMSTYCMDRCLRVRYRLFINTWCKRSEWNLVCIFVEKDVHGCRMINPITYLYDDKLPQNRQATTFFTISKRLLFFHVHLLYILSSKTENSCSRSTLPSFKSLSLPYELPSWVKGGRQTQAKGDRSKSPE